jgi:hypothetical protein
MRAETAVSPNNGFEKASATGFIWESLMELINVHPYTLLSGIWRALYQQHVTDTVTLGPDFWL